MAVSARCRRLTVAAATRSRSCRAGRCSTICAAAWCPHHCWRCAWSAGIALPRAAWLPTLCGVAVLVSPFLFHVLAVAVLWRPGQYWKQECRDMAAAFGRTLVQCILALVFLPFRAYYLLDAVVRTLYRLTISRRKLLEWETSEAAERRLDQSSGVFASTDALDSRRLPCRGGDAAAGRSRAGDPVARAVVRFARGSRIISAGRFCECTLRSRRRTGWHCGGSPGAPGRSSSNSSGRKITGCRRTTFKSSRGQDRPSHFAHQRRLVRLVGHRGPRFRLHRRHRPR